MCRKVHGEEYCITPVYILWLIVFVSLADMFQFY